jgi:hypothetical protein
LAIQQLHPKNLWARRAGQATTPSPHSHPSLSALYRTPLYTHQALIKNNLTSFARVANASGLTPSLNSTLLRATLFVPTDAVALWCLCCLRLCVEGGG